MSATTYRGREYSAKTDWVAELREAAKYPFGPSWLRADLDVASGLAEMAEQLGAPFNAAIADAALELVETGTKDERTAIWQLPWERATNAVERLLQLIDTDRSRLDAIRGVPNVLWRLLQQYGDDARVLAALKEEARANPGNAWVNDMLATHST